MLRTYDIAGIASKTYALIIVALPDTAYSPFTRICESPAWAGVKTNTQIRMPQQWLEIGPDMTTGSGLYNFFNSLNMGRKISTRLTLDLLAFPTYPTDPFIDERPGNTSTWPDWDNTREDLDGRVVVEMRSTITDPTLNEWTPWRPFSAGEQEGWGFQFRATLVATVPQNIGIESMCIVADIRNKIDDGGDIPYAAVKKTIFFAVDFFAVPAITITIQGAVAGDYVILSNKTVDSFDIEIKNGASQVTRTFDWHAMGY